MIELGISAGPAEVRESDSYSDLAVAGLLATANRRDPISSASGAVRIAAGLWARCLATAAVDHPAVTAEVLASIGSDLAMVGEHVAAVQVDRSGVQLLRASSWDVQGGPDPSTWRYRLSLPGPGTMETRTLLPAAVLHVRYLPDNRRPWCGVAPWRRGARIVRAGGGH